MADIQTKKRIPSWAKRIVFALLPAVLFLAVAEVGLRIAGFRFSAEYLRQPIFERDASTGMMRTSPMFTAAVPYGFPFCLEQSFARIKQPGTLRIAMVGESSVFRLGQAETMRANLAELLGQPVEILNFAFQGCGSERVLVSAQEALEYAPDVLMVYVGHNEFVSFSNPATMIGASKVTESIDVAMQARTVQLAAKWLYAWSPPTRDRLQGQQRLYDAADKERFYQTFESNLQQLVADAQAQGVVVVLGTVAYNYAVPPMHAEEGRRPEQLAQLSGQAISQLGQQFPDDANLAFALGQRALARGDTVAAKSLLEQAFLHDARPYRGDSRINEVIRRTADQSNVPLADIHQAVSSTTSSGLPGNELFSDHCHLNVRGNEILMRTFATAIAQAVQAQGK